MQNNKQFVGDLGQHWTPDEIVTVMVSLIQNKGSILEPTAGSGRFVNVLKNCTAIEIDDSVVPAELKTQYVFCNFFDYPLSNKFNSIIGNPPYVAGNLLTPEWFGSWKGIIPISSNAYLHIIEKCINHLLPGGELIFIVPSSLLSDTSRGNTLRTRMMREGAFTHFLFEKNIKWEKAAIDTVIFRWEKDLIAEQVDVDGTMVDIFENKGFIWLPDFEPVATIGDFFTVGVGSAPRNTDVMNGENSENFGLYAKEGSFVKICEVNNRKNWPRVRDTPAVSKIFFSGGPIRRWPVFFAGNSAKHLDNVLLPKYKMDVSNVASLLNDWFKQHGTSLKLIKDGRWGVGIRQLETCPIDQELLCQLEKKCSNVNLLSW